MGDDSQTHPRDDGSTDDPSTWWGRLMPTSEDAIRARHVDRAARARDDGGRARGESALEAKTRGGGIMLRMRSSVVGRIVMNKEGTARAKTQPADIALDAASGAREAIGKRSDGRDLLDEFEAEGGRVILDNDEFRAWASAPAASEQPVIGLFSASHMSFEADRPNEEPSLREMTLAAIRALDASGKRWILLVEAGRIDHAHHAANPTRALEDGVAFSDAIDAARAAVSDDTLVLVTADHDHTLSIQGYPRRGSPITGLCETIGGDGAPCLDQQGKPYPTLSYANGPRSPRTPHEAVAPVGDRNHIVEALVPHVMETHGGTDVAAYAAGPWAHLVSGTLEQNTLFHILRHAAGLPEPGGSAPAEGG